MELRRRKSRTSWTQPSQTQQKNEDTTQEDGHKSWSAADTVVAATAGQNTWKTWAGRRHGDDDLEFLDVFRGLRRLVHNKVIAGNTPPDGTSCPVCFCETEEWHRTSSCGHFVCIDCFRAYAESQVRDSEHHGPLKCPVCSLPLRESDAIAAMANNHELLSFWDDRLRNQVLRALPNFRHCPHCDSRESSSQSMTSLRGGFVTPDCLSPIHEYREYEAKKTLDNGLALLNVGCGSVVCLIHASIFQNKISIFSSFLIFRMMVLSLQGRVARAALRVLFEPIMVDCPCCDQTFALQASAEQPGKSSVVDDERSQAWIGENTRPCPSCSVPIVKIDGCNHMRCSHCRVSFCWACMQVRTRCGAYNCLNGARYGNSLPPTSNTGQTRGSTQDNQSIHSRITYIEQQASREIPTLCFVVLILGVRFLT